MRPPAKLSLVDAGWQWAYERLDRTRETASVEDPPPDEAKLAVSVALGEVLLWGVAYDDVLGGYKRHSDAYALDLCHGVRHARNRLAHGDSPWEPGSNGLTFPLKFPLRWGWQWRSLPRPTNDRWYDQWQAYQITLVGHDVDDILRDYSTEVLGRPSQG